MTQEPIRKFYLKEFKAISHAISTYEDLNLLINHSPYILYIRKSIIKN